MKDKIKKIKETRSSRNSSINYSQYLAGMIDKSISYSEYIAENLDRSISYSEYLVEKIKP